jgi:hypothetical protein
LKEIATRENKRGNATKYFPSVDERTFFCILEDSDITLKLYPLP